MTQRESVHSLVGKDLKKYFIDCSGMLYVDSLIQLMYIWNGYSTAIEMVRYRTALWSGYININLQCTQE